MEVHGGGVGSKNPLCEVDIEKVDIQPSLKETCCYSNWIYNTFCVIPETQSSVPAS